MLEAFGILTLDEAHAGVEEPIEKAGSRPQNRASDKRAASSYTARGERELIAELNPILNVTRR